MFGRPRCREWTPLSSQQLRLRSLIQIVGYNIRPPEGCTSQCSFYLTLHHTTMSAPFYTSERIHCPHPKWKEIDPDITQRMSSTNIVIRIWCHVIFPQIQDGGSEAKTDTIIETWGVYFSGLRYIGANLALNFTSDCFKSNTLVFQMHGGYFCSYKSLKLDIIPPENELENGSLSSGSPGKKIEAKLIPNQIKSNHRSISPSKFAKKFEREYSKSHSPSEKSFKQNFPVLKTSTSLHLSKGTDVDRKLDPSQIYEHSPNSLEIREFANCDSLSISKQDLSNQIDLSETAESYDLRNEGDVPKYRYLALNFLKSEIRPSYNASKLQKLHLLQYSIKKKQEAVQEIKERINKISAVTNNWSFDADQCTEKIRLKRSHKSLFYPDETELVGNDKKNSENDKNGIVKENIRTHYVGSRYNLKLNDLLSYKAKPSPFQRAEHVRLTKQIEILRFKRIILSDERDAKLANIRRLKEMHAKMFEENQDVGTELMQQYHALSRGSEAGGGGGGQGVAAARQLGVRARADLAAARRHLLLQLLQVFPIAQKDQVTWTICDVPLPICGDDAPRTSNPVSDSVASGFVAQAVCIAAAILNQPLRYKIILLGSASKIVDINNDLPDPNIPLFARSGDVTLFRYALFLLNKCIAQVSWARGIAVTDMRPTLYNLNRLLTQPQHEMTDVSKLYATQKWVTDTACPRTQSLRSLIVTERAKYRQFNRFKDAIDGYSPETAMNLRRHRHSRSVGSYNDDHELSVLDTSTTSIMGSEPNIYNSKLDDVHSTDVTPVSLKTHNSDSGLSRATNEDAEVSRTAVAFTLGDDTKLENLETQLVKISTNNGDGSPAFPDDKENVKKICTEIEDFCLQSDIDKCQNCTIDSSMEQTIDKLDLAKLMEESKYGAQVTCETCDLTEDVCDIACANNLSEVILLPDIEALDLGSGQKTEEHDQS